MKNMTIFCKDFELTQSIKAHVEDKLSSLYKFLNHQAELTNFNIRLGRTTNHQNHGKIFYAEASVRTPEKNYGGRIEEEDIYAAIDLLKDELSINITEHRSKTRTLDRKNAIKFKEQLHHSID